MLETFAKAHPQATSIAIEKTARKCARIIIKDDLSIILKVPKSATQGYIEALFNQHKSWIDKTLSHQYSKRHYINQMLDANPNALPIFDRWQSIASIMQEGAIKKPLQLSLFEAPKLAVQSNLESRLKAILLQYLDTRTKQIAKAMGLVYKSISISTATSYFGKCTHDNHLLFSLMLIFAPKAIVDYVIIHELSHIQHKDHSKRFWELVFTFCPNAKAMQRDNRAAGLFYKALLDRVRHY